MDYNKNIPPITKPQIVKISRLSQRVRKDEKENEFNNRKKNNYEITMKNKNPNKELLMI